MLLSVFTCDTAMYLMFAPGFYGVPSSGSCIQTCAYDVRDETRDRERKEELCVCVCFNFCVCVCACLSRTWTTELFSSGPC